MFGPQAAITASAATNSGNNVKPTTKTMATRVAAAMKVLPQMATNLFSQQ